MESLETAGISIIGNMARTTSTCQGEMEGPSRFLLGQAFYAWLHQRHATDWDQRMWFVPNLAHSAGKMFTSECGVAALYERSACQDH